MKRLNDTRPIFLFGLAVAMSGCSTGAADPRTESPLVRAVTVGTAAPGTRAFTGVISARVQSDLGFRVPGKVVQRLVDAGQRVRRGQPLMRIDRTDLGLATITQAGAVAAARARASQTAADEKRYHALVSTGAVSVSSYDQAKAAADAAQAQLDAAQAQAGVARNEAGYSVLLADADGVVVETLAEPGQVVAAAQTVVRLAHSGPREATVNLPETVRPALGTVAAATVFDSKDESMARLRQLSNAADPATRTFEARYVLDGTAAAAPLGATVTIRLSAPSARPVLSLPLAAIFDNGHGPGVWIIAGAPLRVMWRKVQLAAIGDETAIVVNGLHPGDRIVGLGAQLLHQGEVVRTASAAVPVQ